MNLYFAKFAADFTLTYGDIDDDFYTALEENYLKAVRYAKEDENFRSSFADEFELIINDCGCFGWGVYDNLRPEYERVFM